jgi:hypothetical protein
MSSKGDPGMNFTTCCPSEFRTEKPAAKSYRKFFIRASPCERGSEEEAAERNEWQEFKTELLEDLKTTCLSSLRDELLKDFKAEVAGLKAELVAEFKAELLGDFKGALVAELKDSFTPSISSLDSDSCCSVKVVHHPYYTPFFNKSEYITRDCQTSFGEDGTLTMQVGLAGRLFESPIIYPFGECKVPLEGSLLPTVTLAYESENDQGEMVASLQQENSGLRRWYLRPESLQTNSGETIDFQDLRLPLKVSFTGSLYKTT